jgi:HK97 family phage portal protein
MTLFRSERRDVFGAGTYNPFERPSMPLASLALDGVLGAGQNNDAGEPVDVVKGIALPTAYRCIAIISTVLASLTLEEMQKNGDAERWPVLDNLTSYTAFECMEIIGARLAGWGNYYGRKVFQASRLVDLIPYPAGDVEVIRVHGRKVFRIKRRNDDGAAVAPNSSVLYEDIPDGPDCPVFHIPGLGFDGLQGVSPVTLAAQSFGTALAADRLAARFYSKGQQLGGIIKVKAPLASQSQADAIKMNWRSSHGGIRNAGDVAVLDAETDFTPITIAPEALQFLQSRQWQSWEVAKMFGIPAYMIEPSTTWGTGIETQNIGFVAYTMRSYSDRVEQRFTREFGTRGKPLEFDLDRLLRGSAVERAQFYGQAIGWGWMNPNEARKKERMKPRAGGDEFLEPQSMNGALADGPMNTPPNPAGKPGGSGAKADNEEGSQPNGN